MKLSRGKLFGKGSSREIYVKKQLFGLPDRGAVCKHKGDKFILSNIHLAVCRLGVAGVAHKIKSRHAQPLFVRRVIKKRKSVGNVSHAYHGIMVVAFSRGKIKREVPRHRRYLFSVGKFIVKGSPHVKILGFIGCRRAHKPSALLFSLL